LTAYQNRRSKRAHGTTSEQKTAKRLNGRLTPASGALEGAKGDFNMTSFLVECKSTIHHSIGLKLDWLLKIKGEARKKEKMPALTITYVNGAGEPLTDGRYVVLREDDFKSIIERDLL